MSEEYNPLNLKRLFNPDDTWTPEGNEFSQRIEAALNPIFAEAVDKNISARDLRAIAESCVSFMGLELCVRRQCQYRMDLKAKAEALAEKRKTQIPDVHTEHCCATCGCKYGEPDGCSVCSGAKVQSYDCGTQLVCGGDV